jgi:hypothetical protein
MSQFKGHFVLGDLRKFTEQYGDIIQWDQSNRAYIMTHGVSGVEWKHYKHPQPEHVYGVYISAGEKNKSTSKMVSLFAQQSCRETTIRLVSWH